MSCSYESCNFECYESHDKCIFHHDKKDWLTPKTKEWSKSSVSKISFFWQEVRDNRQIINSNYAGFIFPKLEEYPCELTLKNDILGANDRECIENTNFGTYIYSSYPTHFYSFLNGNISFKDAIFLDNADFSRISFDSRSIVSFENVTFCKDFLISAYKLSHVNFTGAIFNNQVDFEDFTIYDCKFTNVIFEDNFLFKNIKATGSVCFSEAIFKKVADFKNTSFSQNTNFSKAQFYGDSLFTESSFSRDVDFSESIFKKELIFKDANINGEVNFQNIKVEKLADFSNGSFGGNANFSNENEGVFESDLVFTGREFRGDAIFRNIIVKGNALFNVNGIAGKANFSKSTFEKELIFEDVDINGEANFQNIKVKKLADFSNGSFESNAYFSNKSIFGNDLVFTGREFKGDAIFPNIIVKGNALFDVNGIVGDVDFSKSIFEKELIFEDVDINGEINFNSIVVKKLANFKNGSFGGNVNFSNENEGIFENDLVFTGRTFNGEANFKNITVSGNALFDVNEMPKKVNFSMGTFGGDLIFKGVDFKDSVAFKRILVKGLADFKNGLFIGEVNFSNKSVFEGNLEFTGRTFSDNAIFKKITVNGDALFDLCKMNKKTDFSGSKFEKDLIFTSTVFSDSCKFININSSKIDFSKVEFIEKDIVGDDINFDFEIIDSNCGLIDFNEAYIGQNFTCKNGTHDGINFQDCIIKERAEVEIRDIVLSNLVFNKYINESGKVLFDFVEVKDRLEIKHVSFDKERFNHFDISKPNIEIENSAFNSNFFNSVKWGSISEKRYTATRDIFRQLKFYSEQQKNYIDADGFYSLEMKEQKKELHKENKELKTYEKVGHFFTNIFVFYLHEKTSNFSQNWWLPIYWLFLLGMTGVIYLNFTILSNKNVIPYMPALIIGLFFISPIYKSFTSTKRLPKWLLYLCISIPIVFLYWYATIDIFDDIAKLINPSNIFKPIGQNETSSGEDAKEVFEFGYLLYKIAVLFLVYQVIVAIKKKVRSK